MQAIITKYHGPTPTRGSRMIARAQRGSITVPYDDALNVEDNHHQAALALAAKFGWTGALYGKLLSGDLPNGLGCVHLFTGRP